MNEEKVLDIVEKHVNGHQPKNFHLKVVREGVRQDGNWWYIVVAPDKDDMSLRDYGAIMSQVEDEIEQENEIKVLLVPVLPGD